jgi:hypothetical protein
MSYPVMFCDEWNGDALMPLNELAGLIVDLQKKYGENACLRFDAGANNVMVLIHPTKEVEKLPPWN